MNLIEALEAMREGKKVRPVGTLMCDWHREGQHMQVDGDGNHIRYVGEDGEVGFLSAVVLDTRFLGV